MKIDWENTTIIAKLSKKDLFTFLQNRQSKVKGRTFVYIENNCFNTLSNFINHLYGRKQILQPIVQKTE